MTSNEGFLGYGWLRDNIVAIARILDDFRVQMTRLWVATHHDSKRQTHSVAVDRRYGSNVFPYMVHVETCGASSSFAQYMFKQQCKLRTCVQ